MIENKEFITIKEIKHNIKHILNIDISEMHICRILKLNNYVRKRIKKKVHINDDINKVKNYKIIMKSNLDKEIICIDETSYMYSMCPLYKWVKKNVSPVYKVSKYYKSKMMTCITMISNKTNKIINSIYNKSINGNIFINYLKSNEDFIKNKIIILDNAKIHKTKEIEQYLGHINSKVYYIIPYHCELNPIEEVFSKIKHYVRKSLPQTKEDYIKSINNTINNINLDEICRYYKHSFY